MSNSLTLKPPIGKRSHFFTKERTTTHPTSSSSQVTVSPTVCANPKLDLKSVGFPSISCWCKNTRYFFLVSPHMRLHLNWRDDVLHSIAPFGLYECVSIRRFRVLPRSSKRLHELQINWIFTSFRWCFNGDGVYMRVFICMARENAVTYTQKHTLLCCVNSLETHIHFTNEYDDLSGNQHQNKLIDRLRTRPWWEQRCQLKMQERPTRFISIIYSPGMIYGVRCF